MARRGQPVAWATSTVFALARPGFGVAVCDATTKAQFVLDDGELARTKVLAPAAALRGTLAVGGQDGSLVRTDVEANRSQITHTAFGPVTALATRSATVWAATHLHQMELIVHDMRSPQPAARVYHSAGSAAMVAFAPDYASVLLATRTHAGHLRVWDIRRPDRRLLSLSATSAAWINTTHIGACDAAGVVTSYSTLSDARDVFFDLGGAPTTLTFPTSSTCLAVLPSAIAPHQWIRGHTGWVRTPQHGTDDRVHLKRVSVAMPSEGGERLLALDHQNFELEMWNVSFGARRPSLARSSLENAAGLIR
eukprot:5432001-Prymnesium_polylepis.1